MLPNLFSHPFTLLDTGQATFKTSVQVSSVPNLYRTWSATGPIRLRVGIVALAADSRLLEFGPVRQVDHSRQPTFLPFQARDELSPLKVTSASHWAVPDRL